MAIHVHTVLPWYFSMPKCVHLGPTHTVGYTSSLTLAVNLQTQLCTGIPQAPLTPNTVTRVATQAHKNLDVLHLVGEVPEASLLVDLVQGEHLTHQGIVHLQPPPSPPPPPLPPPPQCPTTTF